MDPKNAGEMLTHLEKQREVLEETHKSMSHELHKLQVEEEMLMRKFYEIMSSHNITKKSQMGVMQKQDIPNTEFTTFQDGSDPNLNM